MKKRNALLNCVFFSAVSVLVFFLGVATPLGKVIRDLTGYLNLSCLAMSVVVFLLLFLCFGRMKLSFSVRTVFGFNAVAALFLLSSMLFEDKQLDAGGHVGIEHTSPLYLFLMMVILIGIVMCLLYAKKRAPRLSGRGGRALFICLAILIAGLTAYNQYTPNVFSFFFNIYHFNAYTNSIWNVFWGQPYTETVTSIYGHYAFLYYPFLKLAWALGKTNLFKVYMLLSATISAAGVLMWAVVLFSLVKKTSLRLLGLVGVGYITCARIINIYHQAYPHRSFPMAVMALMMVIWMRCKKKSIVNVAGYFVCLLLTLWNTEYGIFSTMAWSALNCCYAIQTRSIKSWLEVICHILGIPAVFALSLLACGLLNRAFGGSMLSVRDFIFPLMSKSYVQGSLEVPLASYPAAWISITACLLGFLGLGLTDTMLFNKNCKKNEHTAVYFGLAVLGLGCLTYAINRPAYGNFYIMMPMMAVFMAVIAEHGESARYELVQTRTANNPAKIQKACLNILAICAMSAVALSFAVNVPYKLNQQAVIKDGQYNTSLLHEVMTYGDGSEYAIGPGAVTVFAMLGWDPKVYFMDFPDININPDAYAEMMEKSSEIKGKGLFYSYDPDPGPVANSDAFEHVQTFEAQDQTIVYCKPTT